MTEPSLQLLSPSNSMPPAPGSFMVPQPVRDIPASGLLCWLFPPACVLRLRAFTFLLKWLLCLHSHAELSHTPLQSPLPFYFSLVHYRLLTRFVSNLHVLVIVCHLPLECELHPFHLFTALSLVHKALPGKKLVLFEGMK